MEMHNIIRKFIDVAERYPDNDAIICQGKSIKYSELLDLVKQKAWHLKEKGVYEGDRVLLAIPMSIDLYVNLLALFYIGAVAVVIDNFKDPKTVNEYLKKADCHAAIFSRRGFLLLLLYRQIRKIKIKLNSKAKNNPRLQEYAQVENESPALITFTTGSTGTPKAALRSHGFLLKQDRALSEIINPLPHEVDFVNLPIILLMNLGVGATSLITTRPIGRMKERDMIKIIRDIKKLQVSRITASPFILKFLSETLEKRGIKLNIKRIYTGGGPVFPSEARKITHYLNPRECKVIYGSTEAEPISVIDGHALAKASAKEGLPVGFIHGGIQIKIIRINKHPLDKYEEMPLTKIGEIIVSGKHVLNTYYNSPKAYRENKITEGNTIWHRTGDAGFLGNDNRLYLSGRVNQMIFLGHMPVSPFLFENSISKIEGVAKGTIILNLNHELEVIVQSKKDKNAEKIIKFLKESKIPAHHIRFIKKMPMDSRHRTKIDYTKLNKNQS